VAGILQENDMEYVSRYVYFVKSLTKFDANKIEKYIQNEDRSVVNTIKRRNVGQSGYITDKPADYYNHYSNKEDEATGLLEDEATGLLEDEATGLLVEDEATGLLMEESQEDEEELWNFINEAIEEACKGLADTRIIEGGNLKKDLLLKLDHMEELVYYIETKNPQIIQDYKKKLEAKMEEILSDADIDKNRIASEVIIYADKVCVDEETVRLRSHIEHARKCLNEDGGIGRKRDFIAQEMNREANTTLSKANNIEISNAAIDLKTEIEKIREQIQNIE